MSSLKLKHSGGNSVSLNPPTSAPTSSDVAFKLPNADGSTGQYMKTDGSGNLGFVTGVNGITHANIYRLHTSFTHSGTHTILTNWEEADDASSGKLGSGWSLPSSGVFSFPATGIYHVKVRYRVRSTGENGWPGCDIKVTQNNGGAYDLVADTFQGIADLSTSSSYNSGAAEAIVDCTDTGQVKFRVTAYADGNGTADVAFEASTSTNATMVSIIRLGDT